MEVNKMPTGYTEIIGRKPEVTFREYALRCSRAFGALIEMRDDSLDAKIPDEFHPDDYHQKELQRAKETLQRAQSMTLEQTAREAEREYQSAVKSHSEALQRNADLRGRYEAMLQRAKKWEAPTKDHENLKGYMISQLEESIKFDCSYSEVEAPQKQTPEQYIAQLVKSAKHDVAYHQKGWKKEVKSARERTKWVQALVRSLPKE